MAKLMRMSRKGIYRGYNKSVISPATPRLSELAGSWTWELPWRSSLTTRTGNLLYCSKGILESGYQFLSFYD
jgi:hypothetical protein